MSGRNHEIKIRLNDKELQSLMENVRKTGMNRERFIRSVLSGIVPKERPSSQMLDVLKQLRQINNNVNQLAAKANSTGEIDYERFEQEAEALRNAINKIMGRIFS